MASLDEDVIMKRPIGNDAAADDGEHDAKHQKLNSDVSLTTITDLNEKCLKKLFSYLSLSCLLNVAQSNKKLQSAAASTFIEEHGTKTIWLKNTINLKFTREIYSLDDDIYVCGLKFGLPFLRCFGATISELLIFDGSYPHVLISNAYKSKFSHHIDHHLNKYCARSVSNLLFYGRPAFSLENFRQPFRKVHRIRLVDSDLENGFKHFAQWYPSLCHLEMYTVCIDDTLMPIEMPVLQHLALKINDHNANNVDSPWEWNFTEQNAINVLHANRQLRSLDIDMADRRTITIHKLLNIIQGNPSIEKLAMTEGSQCEHVNDDELQRLVRTHQLLTEIDLPRHKFTAENIIFCIRYLKGLKHLRCQMTDGLDNDALLQQIGDNWALNQCHQTIQLDSKTN